MLAVRGTMSPQDALTDLAADEERFELDPREPDGGLSLAAIFGGEGGRAHRGMVESAAAVAEIARPIVAAELAANPDLRLVITGHR